MRRNRSSFSFPDFNLRRLLLQGARAARGSPPLGNRCDIEKAPSSSTKVEKSSSSTNKVSHKKIIKMLFFCFLKMTQYNLQSWWLFFKTVFSVKFENLQQTIISLFRSYSRSIEITIKSKSRKWVEKNTQPVTV
jgi:hypothetical protein